MSRHYETVFIATPILTEAQLKDTRDKYFGFLENNGAEIVNKEEWGLKKLRYSINKKNNGYYFLVEFKADPAIITKFETEFKRDENILRFLTVKFDKYAVEYAARRAAGAFNKKKEKEA